jgi:O-antigen/teichoic acid export membrane protein
MLVTSSIIYTLGRVLPGALAIVMMAILTRLLSPESYGTYALAQVVMMLVSNLGFDWLGLSLMRLYEAHRNDPRTIATFVHLFLALVLLTGIVGLLIWILGGFANNQGMIYALGIVLAWCYYWYMLGVWFEIVNFRPLGYVRMECSRTVLILVGVTAVAWVVRDPFWTAVAYGAGMLGGALQGSLLQQPKALRHFNRALAVEIFGYGLPIAFGVAMNSVVFDGTRALLQILDSSKSLGIYSASYALVQTSLSAIASGVSAAGLPLAIRALESDDPNAVRRQLLTNSTLLLAILAPASLGLALTARGLATTILGPDFRSSAIVLIPWMAAGAFFGGIRSFYLDQAFQLSRRMTRSFWVSGVNAGSAITLSLVLIPRMGVLGLAISVTTAMVISCCHAAIAGRRVFRLPIPVQAGARILVCCAFMTFIVISIPPNGPIAFVMQVLLGGLGYVGAAVALNVLDVRTQVISYISHRAEASL